MANRFSQGLYDYLTGKSARNIGSNADEFVSKVSNPQKLQQLYDYMQSHGAKNIGANADEFYALMTKQDEEPSRKELRQQRREQRREMADSVQQHQQALNPRVGSTAPQNARDIYSQAAQDTRDDIDRDKRREGVAEALRETGLKDAAEQELEEATKAKRHGLLEIMSQAQQMIPLGVTPTSGIPQFGTKKFTDEQSEQVDDYIVNKLRQENLKNAVDIMDQVESGKAELVNGIIDQAARVSNWDYGVSNLTNAAEYTRLREKYESGEELTDAEQKALDAVALSTEMERIAGEVLGNGYQIGRGLSQSAAFMIQMASNPARGMGEKLAEKTLKRQLVKYGTRESFEKFGKDLIRKKVLTKAAATRVLGDAAEMAILTSTIGAANVAADTMDRMNGDVKIYVDENGFVQYDGVERQADEARLSGFQLFGKAWLSNYIENWTEAFGEYLPSWKQWKSIFKNGLWKMVDETRKKGIKVGKLDAFQRDLAGNPDRLSKWLSQARKAVKLNGLAGEIIEEELGTVLNAAFVGDNEMSDLKDLDQQIQIIASCAIMTGGFKAAELGSNIRAQRQYDKDIKKADETGRALFGAEAWESEKGHIESLDADQAVEYLQNMMRDDTLTTDQKRAMTTYVAELMSYQTFNRATDIAMVGRLSKDRQDIIDAYNAGRNLRMASGVRKLYQELDAARAEVGGDLARQISRLADEGKPVTKLEGFEGFSKADIDACEKLMILETMTRGLNDGTQDRADDATALLARDLDPVTRVIDGREIVTTAVFTSGTQQTPVYVLDINKDTNMATVIDAEGNKKPVSAKALSEIQDTPRAFLESAYRERYLSDEQQRQDWQSRHNERTQMPEAGMTLFAGDGSTLLVADVDSYNGEVTVVEGEYDPETNALVPKKGMQPYVIPVSSALALQDQHYDRLDAEKTQPENPETPATPATGQAEAQPEAKTQQEQQQGAVETGQKIEGQNTEAAPAEPAAPAVEATDFTQVSDADLDFTVKAIQKDIEKLQKEIAKPIDLRDQKAKDKRAKAQQDLAGHMQMLQEWQAEQDRRGAAAAEAAKVKAEQEAAEKAEAERVERMSRSAAEVPYKEVIDTLSAMEPEMSFEDYVRFALRGAKIVWSSNGIKKGLKDLMIATGTNANSDRGKYISWLANEDNGGKYLADVIHDIYNGMPEQMLEAGYTDVDVRDIVMDALQSFNSPSALMRGLYSDLVARHNQAQLEYEQRTKDEFAREQGFDNYEDYSTFNEIIKSGEYFEGTHTDDEINEIYSIIAQEYESGTEGSTGTGVQGVVSGAAGQEGGSYGSNQMGSQEEAAEQRGGSDEGRPAQRSNNVVAGSAEAGATVASDVEQEQHRVTDSDVEAWLNEDKERAVRGESGNIERLNDYLKRTDSTTNPSAVAQRAYIYEKYGDNVPEGIEYAYPDVIDKDSAPAVARELVESQFEIDDCPAILGGILKAKSEAILPFLDELEKIRQELKKQAPESVSKDSRVRDFGSGITSYKTRNNLNEVFLNGRETGITFYDNKIYITSKNNSSLKNAANKYGYKYESGMRSLPYSGQVVIDFSDDTLEDALKKAVEIFKEVTPDYSSWPMVAIVNGTEVRYLAAGEYYGEDGMQRLAHGIKNNDAVAIKEAARRMSKLIPSHSYIIPMPSRTGKPSDGVMSLCEEICKIKPTLSIKNILRGKERDSVYEAKKNGQKVDLESLKMTETSSGSIIREVQGKVYIIDNVIASGSTAAAAINAIGGGKPVVVTLAVDSKAMNENARLSVSGTQETQNTLFPERDFNTEGLTREQINALDAFQIARWARANRVLGEELKDAEHLRKVLGSYGFLGDDVEVLDSREAGIAKLRELGDEENAKWLEEHPENKLNGFYLKGKVYLAFSEGDNVLSYFRTLSHEGTHAQNVEDKTGINAILEAVNNGTVTEEELHDIIREVDGAEDASRDYYADKTGEELADELLAHVQEAMTLGLMTEDITDNGTLRTILDNYGTEQGKESADKWRKQRDLLNDFGAQLSGRFGRKAAEGGRTGISGSSQRSGEKAGEVNGTQNDNSRLSVTQRTDKEKQELFDAAKNKFGTTTDFREADYLLPDGSLLDFSEKNDGGQPGTRNIDHRAVSGIMGGDYETRTDAMSDFVHSGAIRLMPEAASINLANMPTAKQTSTLQRFIRRYDGEVILEIDNQDGKSDAYAEYEEHTSPSRIINDISRYFNEGIRPEGNVRFSVSVSRSDPFYSNAAKAVEGIQQNKATADQWLAMLQKNGGLKAGEDKWLGLSDWLRQQGAMAAIGERDKAITKQEVQDFIAENAIRIEETRYAEYPESTTNLQDEVLMLWRNSNGNNYDKAEQVQKQLAEKYGDSFNDAVEIWYDGSIRVKDQAAYDRIFNKDGVVTANSTRLGYTSEGLDNKREIALTVPTIEPYNNTNDVHFVDAGEGRAIAWARFGETELVSESGSGDTKLLKEYEDAKAESDAYEKQLYDKYGIPYDDSMESFEKFVMSMTEEENAEWNRLSDAEIEAERKSVDVKRKKVLVIDEIQSKRHQDGREKGYNNHGPVEEYKEAAEEAKTAYNEWKELHNALCLKYPVSKVVNMEMSEKENAQYANAVSRKNTTANREETLRRELANTKNVPDAPFDKNWHELAMKRMLRLAAEEGYDKVAWTSGEQQADRYNIGDKVDAIRRTGNNFTFFGRPYSQITITVDEENRMTSTHWGVKKNTPLSEFVGKELANEMNSMEDNGVLELGGRRIGGEGMKGFYDQILPAFMNKYCKKWGVKVEDIELPDVENGKYTFHSVDVTPEMKESVMQGQAMFRINGGKQKGNSYICADGERIEFQPLLFSDSEWNGTVVKNVDAGSSGVQRKRVSGENTPVGLKLRTLQPGEFCSVERRYTENNHYSFTSGKNKVKTYEDVAYIFKSLQDSAVEHAFAVLVKDGKPTIFHLSIGGFASAPVDFRTIIPAVNDINPDKICMVHNHPSGGIMPSRADTELLYSFHKAFGADKVMDGVIIDSFNGTFSTFGSNTVKREMPETMQGERKVNVYSFDKQVYIKNNPTASIRTSKDIAEFVTTERLGIREKIGALVISQNGFVFGNIYLPYNSLDGNADAIAKELSDTVVRMGGTAAVLYGNNLDIKNAAKVGNIMQKQDITLLDAVDITNEVSGFPYNRYTSAADKGLMEANPVYQKLAKADISEAENEEETVRFRIVTDQKLLERLDGSKTVKVYRAMVVDEHGNLIPPTAGKGLSSNGRKAETSKSALKEWEQSDENLNVADWADGDEYAHIQIKDDAGGNTRVAYNPYIHTSLQMLNDQFAKAWRRPNMVVVECEVPVWEADVEPEKAYKAKGAKNHVGRTTWTDGPVSRTLKASPREVILTRYAKPVRIVPMDEYAASVKQLLEKNGVLENGIPFSNVTPEQRDALYAAGVPISEPVGSGRNAKSMEAYNEWKGEHPTDPTGTDDDIYAMARKAKEARNDIRFSIVGPRAAQTIASLGEPGMQMNLVVAKQMEADGKEKLVIKRATGWERGADGKWRYEIATGKLLDWDGSKVNLSQVWEDNSLFTAYPELKDFVISTRNLSKNTAGYTDDKEIVMNKSIIDDKETMRSFIAHEIQHAIQVIEGFAEGTNDFVSKHKNESDAEKAVLLRHGITNGGTIFNSVYPDDVKQYIKVIEDRAGIDNSLSGSIPSIPIADNYKDWYNDSQYKADRDAYDDWEKSVIEGNTPIVTPEALAEFESKVTPEQAAMVKKMFNRMLEWAQIEKEIEAEKKSGKYNKNYYHLAAGEVEARNEQARKDMSEEERRNTLLSDTEDVPREDQWINLIGGRSDEGNNGIRFRISMPEGRKGGEGAIDYETRVYNHFVANYNPVTDAFVIPEDADDAEISDITGYEGARVKHVRLVIDEAKNTGVGAAHVPELNIIICLATNSASSVKEMANMYFHENVHAYLENLRNRPTMGKERMNRIVSSLAKSSEAYMKEVFGEEKTSEIISTLHKVYDNDSLNEETAAYGLGHAISTGRAGLYQKHCDSYINGLIDNLLNQLGYENQGGRKGIQGEYGPEEDISDDGGDGTGYTEGGEDGLTDDGIRFSVSVTPTGIRDEYDNQVDGHRITEVMQDYAVPIRSLQEVIAKHTGPVRDWENAYKAENRLTSVNRYDMDEYEDVFLNPMNEAHRKLVMEIIQELRRRNNALSKEDARNKAIEMVDRYLVAKHGLERNEVFARRDAEKEYDAYIRLNPNGGKTVADFYNENRDRDYSGLTTLFNEQKVSDAEAMASAFVNSFESKYKTKELWDKINMATSRQLAISEDGGMISAATRQKIEDMFSYYIPLRGFKEDISEDMYDYMGEGTTPYSPAVKTAKGRSSIADSPIATIANMGMSTILQANRNKVKLTMLRLAENHHTPLISVSQMAYRRNDAGVWEEFLPNIPASATESQAEQIMRQFRANLAHLLLTDPDNYKLAGDLAGIPYKVVSPNQKRQHEVYVVRDGIKYILTVNGNPKAAQAINGQLNPETNKDALVNITNWINRNLAANFTTRNPAFVMSNLTRDAIYSNSMVWIKESKRYAANYTKNWALTSYQMIGLLHRANTHTLDLNDETDRLFDEFLRHGGETGYSNLESVEDFKGKMEKRLAAMQRAGVIRGAGDVLEVLGDGLDNFNRWAELISRFACYRTSRHAGRSISRSVDDAKEVTVNFNTKGAGTIAAGEWKKGNRLNYIAAEVSQIGRGAYVFWNAGVQGMTNLGKAAMQHKLKASGMMAFWMGVGYVIAMLMSNGDDGDDDKNKYYNLPKYVRRNNLCFRVRDTWVTIPLAIEIRAMYGMGELAYSSLSGREYYSAKDLSRDIVSQMTQIMPIDMMEGGGGINALVPSSFKPIWELHENKDWTGMPIYKDSPYNKNEPKWQKAYSSANTQLVSLSRWLNENTGGSDHRSGWIDVNPATLEHLVEGYLGGVGTMATQTLKSVETIAGRREFEWRNTPVASRFIKGGDERTEAKNYRNAYFEYKDEMQKVVDEYNGYRRDMHDTERTDEEQDYASRKLDEIVESPEYQFYLFEWLPLYKEIQNARDTGDKELEDEVTRKIVEAYRSFRMSQRRRR